MPLRILAADKKPPTLSPYNTNRLRLQLVLREPLLARLESLILRLLHVFDDDASRIRASVMKAVSELVQADPTVMAIPVRAREALRAICLVCRLDLTRCLLRSGSQQVARVMAGRLNDPSRLVRAEALDLLGRNLQAVPRLLASYFDLLLGSVRDEGVMVRKKAVAIFRELFLSGSLQPERALTGSAAASDDSSVFLPLLLPPANGRSVRALLALLQRNTDPREEESIRDALQSLFEEIWFGAPRAWQHSSGTLRAAAALPPEDVSATAAAPDPAMSSASAAAPQKPSRVTVKANKSAVARADVASVSSLVAEELAQRTSQLVSVIDATAADGRAAEWVAELLRRLLSPSAPAAVSADGVSVPEAKAPRRAAAAHAGTVVPGIGPWTPAAAGGAFVGCLVSSLHKLSARRSKIIALQPSAEAPGTAMLDGVATGPAEGSGCSPPGYAEARSLYEREVIAALATLKAFAQASPALLSPHVLVLAPFLRGDSLLLSPSSNAAVLQLAAGLIELAVPACSPPPDASFVERIVADLVHLVQVCKLGVWGMLAVLI